MIPCEDPLELALIERLFSEVKAVFAVR